MFKLGIKFLNKLSFTRKFQVILFTLLLPILYASITIYIDNNNRIELGSNKVTGLETVNTLKPLTLLAAKHRGNLAQWFSGNKALESTILSLEQDMSDGISIAAKQLNKDLYTDNIRQQLNQLKQEWKLLTFNSINTENAIEAFLLHNTWIKKADDLIRNIATQSSLNRDLNIATHKLMEITVFALPQLQELLGQLRGIGASAATKGSFDSKSFILASSALSKIESALTNVEYDFSLLQDISAAYVPRELQQAKIRIKEFHAMTNKKLIMPDSPTISGSDYFSLGTDAIKQTSLLRDAINIIYQNELYKSERMMQQDLILSLGSFFLLFLISCYLFMSFKITVDYNAHITQTMARDLEEGCLNKDYHSDSKDELGNTINALKTSYTKLRGIVSRVRAHSDTLSNSSENLSHVSEEVNALGEDQKNRVTIISTAATELAATAEEVSSHCDHAANKMQESQQQASLGAAHSHSSAEVIRTLASNVRNAGDEIGELAQQAASISTVIDVIKAIAEQTNLLALNAAIEAARAGEQGRGFAVVADEVRTLATRTQESTNEIENTISSLQQVAEKAVLAMTTSCDQASQSELEATKTGDILSSIEASINEVSNLIDQVATAGVQQAEAANDIARNILAVDDASSNLLSKSQSMSSIAKEVGQDSFELNQQMKSFTV